VRRAVARAGLVLAALAATANGGSAPPSYLGRVDLEREVLRWELPERLREISGLALTHDGRLLAHEDQNGIVYELDAREGRLRKAFALGSPTAREDFEGIAVAGDRVYLVTSGGRLYEAREGEDGERVRFHGYDTGADRDCADVEGLDYDARGQVLLLACKQARADARGSVGIYRWSPALRAAAEPAWMRIPEEALARPIAAKRFRPSALALEPGSGNLLLLSSDPPALAELAPDGGVLSVRRLSADEHRQPEGLAVDAAGALYVADEGAGRAARLSRYTAGER